MQALNHIRVCFLYSPWSVIAYHDALDLDAVDRLWRNIDLNGKLMLRLRGSRPEPSPACFIHTQLFHGRFNRAVVMVRIDDDVILMPRRSEVEEVDPNDDGAWAVLQIHAVAANL